jgi:hypothetical protein
MDAVAVLPKQVAALQAIARAITQHRAALDEDGREVIDAIASDVDRLAEIIALQLPDAGPTEH